MAVSLIDKQVEAASPDPSEAELRIQLAAAYRIIAHHGWDDGVATHISLRVPGPQHHFLINPFGMLFEEVTASSLIKVDLHGDIVEGGSTGFKVNRAGFVIHSALHESRADAVAVMHCHTTAGTAISAQRDGLLPIGTSAMMMLGRIGYHDFEGVTTDDDEKPRLVADLGPDNWALILRNHGTLTVGDSLPLAFLRMFWLEKACAQQVAALAGNRELTLPDDAIFTRMQGQRNRDFSNLAELLWDAEVRRLDRRDGSYRD